MGGEGTETPSDINILLGKLVANVDSMKTKTEQIDRKVDSLKDDLKDGMSRMQITCREFELCQEKHREYEKYHEKDQERITNIEAILKDDLETKEKVDKIYAQNQYIKIVLGVMWAAILLFVTLIQQGILMVDI